MIPRTNFNVDNNRARTNPTTPALSRAYNAIRSRSSNSLWRVSILLFAIISFTVYYNTIVRPNPFDQSFCDADGTCHEKPDAPSPRTVYSAWNKDQYEGWWKYYETLNERADDYSQKRQAMYDDNKAKATTCKTRPLILLGDSITESWSGTGLGVHKIRADGVPKVLEDELSASASLDPVVLGVSGDQTQHLLYRLQNGHMHAAQLKSKSSSSNEWTTFYDPSAIFIVMIGTNNLGAGELPGPTTQGILAIVEYLLKETAEAGCHIMLFQVLPRGDGKETLPMLCPPRCSSANIPYTSFLPAIRKVNEALKDGIQQLGKTYSASSRVQLIDCGSEFVNNDYQDNGDGDNYEVKKEIMPDLLHPNAAGHLILAKCIRDYVDQIGV